MRLLHAAPRSCHRTAPNPSASRTTIRQATAVLQAPRPRPIDRPPQAQLSAATQALRALDPDFAWHELPVAITVRGSTCVRFRGRFTMDGHEIYLVHGPVNGLPGTDACLAIARVDVCQPVAANATALLVREWLPVSAGS